MLSCAICRKAHVNTFGQICYNCWFSANHQRMVEEEEARRDQLELFPISESTENNPTVH